MKCMNNVTMKKERVSEITRRLSLPAGVLYFGEALVVVAGLMIFFSLFSSKVPMDTAHPESLFLCAFDVLCLGVLAVLFWLHRTYRCEQRRQREMIPLLLGSLCVIRLFCLAFVNSSMFDREVAPLSHRILLLLACSILWLSCDTERQFEANEEDAQPVLDDKYPPRLFKWELGSLILWLSFVGVSLHFIHGSYRYGGILMLCVHSTFALIIAGSIFYMIRGLVHLTMCPPKDGQNPKFLFNILLVMTIWWRSLHVTLLDTSPEVGDFDVFVVVGFCCWLSLACWKTDAVGSRRQKSEDEPLDIRQMAGATMLFLCGVFAFFLFYEGREEKDLVVKVCWLCAFVAGGLGYLFRRPPSRKVIIQTLALLLALKPLLTFVLPNIG